LRSDFTISNRKHVATGTAELLDKDLQNLVSATGLGSHLKVCFAPKENSALDGEVKDDTIWIYCHPEEKARQTLRHEFIDWVIVEAIEPYEQLVNLQRAAINAMFRHVQEQSYNRKEQVVEALLKLIQTGQGSSG
jgi:hypothetical protein